MENEIKGKTTVDTTQLFNNIMDANILEAPLPWDYRAALHSVAKVLVGKLQNYHSALTNRIDKLAEDIGLRDYATEGWAIQKFCQPVDVRAQVKDYCSERMFWGESDVDDFVDRYICDCQFLTKDDVLDRDDVRDMIEEALDDMKYELTPVLPMPPQYDGAIKVHCLENGIPILTADGKTFYRLTNFKLTEVKEVTRWEPVYE